MPNAYFYSNIASPTTLSGNINSSVGSCTVASTAGWPSSTPYVVAIDFGAATEELVEVTNNASGTLTILRGFGGTSGVSHSSGAVVRHVYNAQDATDFRTHQAATAAVHGIAGSFVGTTDAQVLTNKTLTSPSITGAALSGGGSMAGTFSGTPTFNGAIVLSGTPSISAGAALAGTFSGSPTFSGTATVTGGLTLSGTSALVERAAAADNAYRARVAADTNSRFLINADGRHVWGSGAATGDTNLYRSGADALMTDDAFTAANTVTSAPTSTSVDALAANLPTSTTADLLNLRVNAAIQAAMDSSGAFRIYQGNAAATFTPTWSGLGAGTLSTNVGWYWRLGKQINFEIYAVVNVAGTGASGVAVQFPTEPFRAGNGAATTRQSALGFITNSNAGVIDGVCIMPAFAGDTGTTGGTIRRYDWVQTQGSNYASGTVVTIQGWFREA